MRTHILIFLATLVFATACGVTYRGRATVHGRVVVSAVVPQRVIVTARPPAVQAAVTVRPTSPSSEAVWVDGYWSWEGRWTWVPGHWETGRRGYVWVAPVANEEGGSVAYHPGYWCPEGSAPDPVYARPGTVQVTVRPHQDVVVRPHQDVVVRPHEEPTPNVRPAGSGGTVVVRGGGSAVPPQPSGGTVVVRGGGSTAPPPRGGASGGTVVVRGGTTGTVHTPEAGAVRGTTSSTATTTRAGAAVAPRPNVTTTTTRAGAVAAPGPGQTSATTRTDRVQSPTPRVTTTVTPPRGVDGPGPNRAQASVPLTCRLSTPRAPMGGLVTIDGSGFGRATVVTIGGSTAVVRSRSPSQLTVQAPNSPGGGLVRIVDDGRNASCGELSISSR